MEYLYNVDPVACHAVALLRAPTQQHPHTTTNRYYSTNIRLLGNFHLAGKRRTTISRKLDNFSHISPGMSRFQ